jgi:two-component system sensor histidine kinase/response regulator
MFMETSSAKIISRTTALGTVVSLAGLFSLSIIAEDLYKTGQIPSLYYILFGITIASIVYLTFLYMLAQAKRHNLYNEFLITKFATSDLAEENKTLQATVKTREKLYERTVDKSKNFKISSNIIIDNILDSVIKIDETGKILSFNNAAEKSFGYKLNEILGENINTLIPSGEDDIIERVHQRQSNLIGVTKEIIAKRKDGSECYVVIAINEINTNGQLNFVIIIRDVTDKRIADEKIKKYTDRLEWAHFEMQKARLDEARAHQAKSEFLANMSHEIRTPLNGVIGMTELLLNTDLSEKQQRFATQIYNSGEHLLGIINDILDFSKIEAGEMSLEFIPFDLKSLTHEIQEMFSAMVKHKGIGLKIKLQRDLPKNIIGDPLKIRQILTNLIGNAIKFTEKGSVELAIFHKITDDQINLSFKIKDTGIGIPSDQIGKLFDKFMQADVSTTRKFGGTGLGLAICKQLVELMGGKIGVESKVGKWSLFWFDISLPLKQKIEGEVK